MSNSVDLAEPSHLDLCCLQKHFIIVCGSERVKEIQIDNSQKASRVSTIVSDVSNALLMTMDATLITWAASYKQKIGLTRIDEDRRP